MKTTAANPGTSKTIFRFVGAGLAVVTLVWAALLMRGPDISAQDHAELIESKNVLLQDGRHLRVQTHEVTISEWQKCNEAGYCELNFASKIKDVDYPATGLSYPDAMQFIAWINTQSDLGWRLPTSSEWTYIAAEVMPEKPDPIFTDPALNWASTYLIETNRTGRALRPSGAFSTTSSGLADLDGNVWEWTQDCYAGSDGQDAVDPNRCPAFIMGGEHEAVMSYLVRDPARGGCAVGAPPAHLGMRLVSEVS